MRTNKYDIIVIGGGHAGIEAANASAKMGCSTALVTMSLQTIGRPSCNPSIGGSAKGHLVKEIDALGGAMGLLADRAGLHFKMLNRSKGPAIWSPRAQIDKDLYPKYVLEYLLKLPNLTLIPATVNEILIKNDKVEGIRTSDEEIIYADAIVFCAGTFLNGVMWTGEKSTSGGRVGEVASKYISDILNQYGFDMGRLKTGTPPRVLNSSIDYNEIEPALGDDYPEPFSYKSHQVKNTIICYHTQTGSDTHDILRLGFDRSPMFSGLIQGSGPRYCPSIEDKISRFADKDSHKILLEPEGMNTNSVYVNGFSTSLPEDIQVMGLRSIPGLRNCKILRPGYAIEYDFFYPYQLKYTLETKAVEGLFFAGQINGTSGYEEAAGQGLIAGINAALKIKHSSEFTLMRSEAYIGVLIDDLVNKSTDEPYRIFTSLAEYRLLLRQDNAYERLMKYGYEMGLVHYNDFEKLQEKLELRQKCLEYVKEVKIKADTINPYLHKIQESEVRDSTDIYTLVKRSAVKLSEVLPLYNGNSNSDLLELINDEKLMLQLQTEIKYEGYIQRQTREIDLFLENEHKKIPKEIDYYSINSLSSEAREKLSQIRPESLGQASRISGVSASDISILTIYLK